MGAEIIFALEDEKQLKERVSELKRQWQYDPIWALEETPGFESVKEELRQYRLEREADWRDRNERKLIAEMLDMGLTSGNDDHRKLYNHLNALEATLDELAQRLEKLEAK